MRFSAIRAKKGVMAAAALAAAVVVILWSSGRADSQAQVIRIGGSGAFLGIRMEDVTAENMSGYKLAKEQGVIVSSTEKGSPAEAATLQQGDVILEYAGIPVLSAAHLTRLVEDTPVGRNVELAVSRDGRRLTLTAKLGERGRDAAIVRPRAGGGPDLDLVLPGGGKGGLWLEGPGPGRAFRYALPAEARPRLGVTLENLTGQMAEFLGVPSKEGALVSSVTKGTPAETKLKAGDVIVWADGKVVRDPEDVISVVQSKDSGANLELKVIRDKKEITVTVQMADSGPRRTFRV